MKHTPSESESIDNERKHHFIGIDIGGSLFKISECRNCQWNHKIFSTERYDDALIFLKQLVAHDAELTISATGGGSYRLSREMDNYLPCNYQIIDEMEALVLGAVALHDSEMEYPFILMNIGSGVSIVKVESAEVYRRVSGTSLGGGTFRGMAALLAGVSDFKELLELAARGSSQGVDLLVGDIYGSDYSNCGLKATVPASSFGKAGLSSSIPPNCKPEDLVYSLMLMICNNLAHISFLNSQLHNVQRILLAGGFVDGNGMYIQMWLILI
ncbi:Pantothenate kinase [Paramicrosporidium saccamoebae]|uniref:Pantothenate kinase n=1 Tax=Paramicrosporidium saccamoebae TaxID=1246581 RepID=A0A2H9TFJ8_9FUNG|nr:Pantothenate kinase [Paramicrosporidium saccamoebae]